MIRLAAISLVEDLGFEAVEAVNAAEAILLLIQRPDIRIVFTDIHMGGTMDGLQLVEYATHRWPPLKFIVVSGEERPALETLPGGSHFFAKPYDPKLVSSALTELAA